LSAAAHASAGGCVSVVGIALVVLLLGASTWTQLSRERSTGFLVGWLGLGQVLGHGILELTCRGPAHAAAGPSLPMLGLHAVAVVVAAITLARGEHRLWQLARALELISARLKLLCGRLAIRGVLPATTDVDATALPCAEPSWQASPWCSLRPVRRGPPARALSAASA
jgi:hypothetical protein